MCSFGVSASNGESLVIGLNFILPPVLTSTTVTSPVLDTLPRSVRPSNLALVCLAQTLRQHLLRDYLLVETICDGIQFSVGKYSRIKRFHTLRITSSTQSFCLQLLHSAFHRIYIASPAMFNTIIVSFTWCIMLFILNSKFNKVEVKFTSLV